VERRGRALGRDPGERGRLMISPRYTFTHSRNAAGHAAACARIVLPLYNGTHHADLVRAIEIAARYAATGQVDRAEAAKAAEAAGVAAWSARAAKAAAKAAAWAGWAAEADAADADAAEAAEAAGVAAWAAEAAAEAAWAAWSAWAAEARAAAAWATAQAVEAAARAAEAAEAAAAERPDLLQQLEDARLEWIVYDLAGRRRVTGQRRLAAAAALIVGAIDVAREILRGERRSAS